jgi:hypothetical protein
MGGLLLPAAAILGSMAAYGFFSGAFKKHSHHKLEIRQAAKPIRSSPLITKVQSVPITEVPKEIEPTLETTKSAEPVLETKSAEPVLETKSVEPKGDEVAEPKGDEVVAETKDLKDLKDLKDFKVGSAEETFEQYRQAMLTTGPRDLEHQARVEMQTKGGMANNAMWRAQTASLRKSLQNDDPAEFLERSNISVNDRVLSSFHASREA